MPRAAAKRKDPAARPAVERGIPEKFVDTVLDVLAIDEEQLTLDSKLCEDLGADSLDCVELSMALESEYGIDIDDETCERWETGTVQEVLDDLKKAGARIR